MSEKRYEKRSPIELAASYGMGEDEGSEHGAKINNMSSGGFCFSSDNKLKVGDKMQLAVGLDDEGDVVINVKVVWVKKDEGDGKYAVGVQIEDGEGQDLDRFIEFYNSTL